MTALTLAGFPASAATDDSNKSFLLRIADWLVELMEIIGPVGAGLAVALENLFPPIPSEAILPLAGIAAGRGLFPLWQALLWATIGSIVGAYALYWIGRALGRKRTRWVFERLPLVKVEDVDKTEAWFERHGTKAVFFGRMLPIFRSLISIPAGITRMHQGRFLVLTAAGSLVWNTIFVLAGFWLGDNWHIVEDISGVLQNVIIAVVILLLLGFIGWRMWGINREKQNAAAGSGAATGPTPGPGTEGE
jgi:membrane protein DedA with SNARE-associated domain